MGSVSAPESVASSLILALLNSVDCLFSASKDTAGFLPNTSVDTVKVKSIN